MNRYLYIPIVLSILSLTACGLRERPGALPAETESHPVAVAEIYELELPSTMDYLECHTLGDAGLYLSCNHYNTEEKSAGCLVLQTDIRKEYGPDIRIWEENASPLALVPGRDGECCLFGELRGSSTFFLNVYDREGTLLRRREYAKEEFEGMAKRLTDGLMTEDGQLYLYAYGKSSTIFVLDQEGTITETYTSPLESLEGIAAGRENRVYAYCITGDEPLFMELGASGTVLSCAIRPGKVYGGYDDGLYLSTSDGFWQYLPETGETNLLWEWDGDYMQLDVNELDQVFCGRDGLYLLFYDQTERPSKIKESLTIAKVTFQDSRDYPGKQLITLGTVYDYNENTHVEELVRLYNRQSRDFRVELVTYDDSANHTVGELELELMRGDGPDLMELMWMDASALATQGVFENLDKYYRDSNKAEEEDLLDCVRASSRVMGQNILVIPSFHINSMISKQDIAPQDWTPWSFLELAAREQLFEFPSRNAALTYCMGIRYGEHFIDYDKKECYFDSEEFISILEQCAQLDSVEMPLAYRATPFNEGAFLMETRFISSTADYLSTEWYMGKVYWVGRPGWEGMENDMYPDEAFAINSASPNKDGAWDFLEFLLSRELQDRIDWGFPSRKDSFEAYLNSSYVPNGKYTPKDFGGTTSFGYKRNPTEEDFAIIRHLVDTSLYQTWGHNGNTVRNIVEEEADMYFSGDATIEETVKKIQSRVILYLNEF